MTRTMRCDGLHRRQFLRLGVISPLGISLADQLISSQCASAADSTAMTGKLGSARKCILLWLDGGPSHLETFDIKPDAPQEVRGPFGVISTNVPGIHLSELLPETARLTQHLSIIRSMTSPLGEHGLANQYLLTGYTPSPVLQYPSFGSVLAHQRAAASQLPPYVAIPNVGHAGAGYLGQRFSPFETVGDPARPDFQVADLQPWPAVTVERLHRRREFLAQFDRATSSVQQQLNGLNSAGPTPVTHVDGDRLAQAYRLITSNEAKKAFDLAEEPESIRARYGPRSFGQSCLLARRLVERGVPFVTVQYPGWDTHDNLVQQLKLGYAGAKIGVGLVPTFDLAFSALVEDLAQRGLLQETLVIAMGEFGRTPKLNTRGGRDHWPRVFSIVLAGGGVRGGQVIGSSDRVGESPLDQPVTPADLAVTIYTLLGIDPARLLRTSDGRPVPINQGGKFIEGLC